ncbi:uncharacterized protein GLRG_11258 [Colletotrichum graminicola M1.001]|uniref:Uncharacterized protein n=1 Tax=Colletotrichum graminicola (strain M1.001 / M2 / FGSC 10212) TaxID=645133 RepID=E3QZ26_COLGM|nr:uncharacterized protein GLRG_11258 [Colletotrichum graminicola M1.001]EFQ36114.1 hypothetical protein GLRG_11258 [Colletotrichum graminicola M1.001]
MLEDMEDDGLLAFPTTDHDCSYAWAEDDDLEDVYSDFGAIFGGAANNGEIEDDGHSYEEYLDELDGISWVGERWQPEDLPSYQVIRGWAVGTAFTN